MPLTWRQPISGCSGLAGRNVGRQAPLTEGIAAVHPASAQSSTASRVFAFTLAVRSCCQWHGQLSLVTPIHHHKHFRPAFIFISHT